jgi:NAD(P)-dependent dehydrogenase (short-subunit alcohol dehydrogenase family)
MNWTLVTGGAKNLGAVLSKELASHGYPVVIHYKDSAQEAKNLVKECLKFGVEAECIQGDFSTLESTKKFINEYQRNFPDTQNLINNVGNFFLGSSLKASAEQWIDLFQTNLHAPYMLIQNLVPSIKKQKGSIINLGVAGLNSSRADIFSTAYTITKSALFTLTKSLALELAHDGVRVNMISPGYLTGSIDLPKDLSKIPMHRLGEKMEIAETALFLLSEKALYITGQNIEIAGGVRL